MRVEHEIPSGSAARHTTAPGAPGVLVQRVAQLPERLIGSQPQAALQQRGIAAIDVALVCLRPPTQTDLQSSATVKFSQASCRCWPLPCWTVLSMP